MTNKGMLRVSIIDTTNNPTEQQNSNLQATRPSLINPLINLGLRGIALTAPITAARTRIQFANLAFTDPFIQHAAQRIGLHGETVGKIDQCGTFVLFKIIFQIRKNHR